MYRAEDNEVLTSSSEVHDRPCLRYPFASSVAARARFAAASMLLFAGLSACGGRTEEPASPETTPSPVLIGVHDFAGVAWLSSGWLVVGLNPENVSAPNEIWRLRPDGEGFHRLRLPEDSECQRTDYLSPVALPDGRVGLVKACFLESRTAFIPIQYSLVAARPRDSALEPLVTTRPLGYLRSFAAPGLTVSPDMSVALVSAGNILCESIVAVDSGGVRYLPVTVGAGSRSWRLDEYFVTDARLCTELGRAGGAAWSPDGRRVAFLGSPQSIGVSGTARLDVPWNLYLMGPNAWTPRLAFANIVHPSEPAWSPNGRWLVFSGSVPNEGEGTWLFDIEEARISRLTSTPLTSPTWSPNGQAIVGTRSVDSQPGEELVVVDVSQLVSTG